MAFQVSMLLIALAFSAAFHGMLELRLRRSPTSSVWLGSHRALLGVELYALATDAVSLFLRSALSRPVDGAASFWALLAYVSLISAVVFLRMPGAALAPTELDFAAVAGQTAVSGLQARVRSLRLLYAFVSTTTVLAAVTATVVVR